MKRSIEEELKEQKRRGVFLVLTGPTGSGKDAALGVLQQKLPQAHRVITTTSRGLRPGESEGNPYHFISRNDFEQKIAAHAFFEWVEFRGNLYGTENLEIEETFHSGKDVILKIETKGVKNIKEKIKAQFPRSVFVFLTASSLEILEERIQNDEKGIQTDRWNSSLAAWEMEQYDDCEYLLINDNGNLEKTATKLWAIIETKRLEIIKDQLC